jgi:hypothetical protein
MPEDPFYWHYSCPASAGALMRVDFMKVTDEIAARNAGTNGGLPERALRRGARRLLGRSYVQRGDSHPIAVYDVPGITWSYTRPLAGPREPSSLRLAIH